MKGWCWIAIVLCFGGLGHAATNRERFSNGAVHLSYTLGPNSSSGSGFILFRPADASKVNDPSVSGQAFLVTNKHVLPPEGTECKLSMRVTTGSPGNLATKTIELPIVGADGKYMNTVRLHPKNDVAAVAVTRDIVRNGMSLEAGFVFTTQLGTRERLKNDLALVGDEIYILGFPAGIFDARNANPPWRIGIIATSPLLGYAFPEFLQKTWGLPAYIDGFLIDSQVYPGSSGSVVVIKPQVTSFDSPGMVEAGGRRSIPYVLGIVSDSIPIVDGRLNLISRMGLGIVQSADAVNDTIESFFKK